MLKIECCIAFVVHICSCFPNCSMLFNKSSCCCFAVGVSVIPKARTGPLALLGQSQASPSQDSKAARLSIPIISLCAAIEPNPTNPEP